MALSTVQSNNQLVKYLDQFTVEWSRENLFSPYQGTEMTSVIRVINALKQGGEQVNIPILAKLRGEGVGSGTLTGNEESLDDYGMRAWIDWSRNAIKMKKNEKHKQSADAFAQARPLLNVWADEMRRDETIEAFMAIPTETQPANLGSDDGDRVNGTRFEDADATAKNAWNAANSDRVLYGNSEANYNATFATALSNVDATDDLFTAESSNLLKKIAKRTSRVGPAIKPHKISNGKEFYVAFHGTNTFRDLQTSLKEVDRDARSREGKGMDSNPLFQDGDELYRGVVHVEIPEIDNYVEDVWTTLKTAGANSARVNPVFFCGQQALAFVVGQMPQPVFDKADDYGFLSNAGIEMAYGVAKMFRKWPKSGSNLKQLGVVSGFFAATGT